MSTEQKPEKAKLYNINGKLLTDVEVRQAKTKGGDKPYAYGRVETKGGKAITIMTFVKNGIEALDGKKAGDGVRLYGTFTKGDKGRTFSAMGLSPEKAKGKEAPAPSVS
jgi:uncharacterized OB-fold protein